MSLAPLLDAAPAIPFHAVAAMTAFVLGIVQLAAPKGTCLIARSVAVLAARRHHVRAHKITTMSIFAGALVIAGLSTLVPGRLMHTVLFGG
jgi:uncharacterized membrane protein